MRTAKPMRRNKYRKPSRTFYVPEPSAIAKVIAELESSGKTVPDNFYQQVVAHFKSQNVIGA